MAVWTHVPNVTVLFFSLSYLVMDNIKGQVHVAQEILGEVPVRKCLCVRGLNDKHRMCHRLLGAHPVLGWGCERSLRVQAYPQRLLVQSSSGMIFDFAPPDPHSCVFLLMLGVLWQEIQSMGKKPQPQEAFLLCSSSCCYFLMHIHIPTSQISLKWFGSLEVVRQHLHFSFACFPG